VILLSITLIDIKRPLVSSVHRIADSYVYVKFYALACLAGRIIHRRQPGCSCRLIITKRINVYAIRAAENNTHRAYGSHSRQRYHSKQRTHKRSLVLVSYRLLAVWLCVMLMCLCVYGPR